MKLILVFWELVFVAVLCLAQEKRPTECYFCLSACLDPLQHVKCYANDTVACLTSIYKTSKYNNNYTITMLVNDLLAEYGDVDQYRSCVTQKYITEHCVNDTNTKCYYCYTTLCNWEYLYFEEASSSQMHALSYILYCIPSCRPPKPSTFVV